MTPVPDRRWALAAWAYGLLVAAGMAYYLVDVPIQLSDSFGNIIKASDGTLGSLVYNEFFQRGYLRPFLWGHLRVVLDVAGGDLTAWFRWWHAGQLLALVVMYLALFRPRTATDAAVTPIGLAMLVGLHTFHGTVREAFPINTFMTILLCCFGAMLVVEGRWRWWKDLLALLLFVFATLTVESGLLVWVVLAAAFLAGARGVSKPAQALLLGLFVGYFYLRFSALEVGAPGLIERSSGFGFGSKDPEELIALFGGNPLGFYAYNVVTSALSVLFSEPRGGVWDLTRDVVVGEVRPYGVVNLVASTLATGAIAAFAWTRRRVWLARRFEPDDRLVFVFIGVLAANAVISYPYTKDVVMSPAGIFFALAAAVSLRQLAGSLPGLGTRGVVLAACCVALLSGTWAVRAVGAHLGLRTAAVKMRNEWAYVDAWMAGAGQPNWDDRARTLRDRLQRDAILSRPARTFVVGDWTTWFDHE